MSISAKMIIDSWWKGVLSLGASAVFLSFIIKLSFIENKHLCGLGIGMFLIGISTWIAEKHYSTIKPPNAYTGGAAYLSWTEIHYNVLTGFLLIVGIVLVILFGFIIIKNLF